MFGFWEPSSLVYLLSFSLATYNFVIKVCENNIIILFHLSYQMFDISEEEFDSTLGEICSNSDNDVDLLGGKRHLHHMYSIC